MTMRPGDQRNVRPQPKQADPVPADPRDKVAQQALLDDDDLPGEPEPVSEEETSAESESALPKKKLTAAEQWRANLQHAEITEAEANTILDAFVSPGFYHKDFVIMNGRVRFSLRTREAENMQRVMRAVDRLANPSNLVVGQTTLIYNLVGSLWKYSVRGKNEVILPFPTAKTDAAEAARMFDNRFDFVTTPENIPAPILDVLLNRLYQFDRQVAAALSEGAVEGF